MITKSFKTILFLLAMTIIGSLLTHVTGAEALSSRNNEIVGTIVDAETGDPIIGATIAIMDKFGGALSDTTGYFILKNLRDGVYQIQISHIGYETQIFDSLDVQEDETLRLTIQMVKQPVSIKGVTVTPGQFSIMGHEPAARQALTRKVIETRPQLSEDLFRAVQRLPGITYNDFSAKFTIRGGEQDEVLINLDGMEIYEPFHLKDVDGGVVSITDIAAIEGVDLMSGGYPAVYGDRMSGVFNIRSKNATGDRNRVSLGLSLMNARFLSEGTFADKRGSWLVSGRRGYLDLVLKLFRPDEEVSPRYYDVFSKVRYKLNNQQILSASFLRAGDDLKYRGALIDEEDNRGDTLLSSYGNTYFWVTLDSYLSSKLIAKTIASVGRVSHDRVGQVFDNERMVPEMWVSDKRNFDLFGVKNDWEYEATRNFLFRAGIDLKHMSANYDYSGYLFSYQYTPGWVPPYQLLGVDSNVVAIEPEGDKFSGYLSNRIRFTNFLTGEFGLRYDYTSYSNDDNVSPRANLAVTLSDNTSIRAGWGHFYQVERMDEISVQDGETEFYPSERAEHFVVGFDHNFKTGENLRLNAFYKKYESLRPSYRNIFGELVTFPELEDDRVRVTYNGKRAKGIEAYIKKDVGEKISWWFSYSLSEVDDDVKNLYYLHDGIQVNYDEEFPFPYDQLHTLYFDLNYRFNLNWQFNLAWQFHTGWPYTEVNLSSRTIDGDRVYVLEADDPWQGRHESFKRLDLRLNRKFFTSRGTITAFIEVINVLGAENVRNYEYALISTDGVLSIEKVNEDWFGTMPSFGITYDFLF